MEPGTGVEKDPVGDKWALAAGCYGVHTVRAMVKNLAAQEGMRRNVIVDEGESCGARQCVLIAPGAFGRREDDGSSSC